MNERRLFNIFGTNIMNPKNINIRLQEITRMYIIILNYLFRIVQYTQGIKV